MTMCYEKTLSVDVVMDVVGCARVKAVESRVISNNLTLRPGSITCCYMAAPSSSVASLGLASPFWSTPALALARSRTLLAHDAASISTTPRAGASSLAGAGVVGPLAATEAACPPVCCSTLAAARA